MKTRTKTQVFLSIINPFRVARLRRNIRAWLPAACKNSRSVEAEFVAQWSYELASVYGL